MTTDLTLRIVNVIKWLYHENNQKKRKYAEDWTTHVQYLLKHILFIFGIKTCTSCDLVKCQFPTEATQQWNKSTCKVILLV